MKVLNNAFYNQDPITIAKALLGKLLIRNLNNQTLIGRIVEVEAYLGPEDAASHSYIGKTKRNQSLYLDGGHAYIHQIHMQNCLDIVVQARNSPRSVLIRALEPVKGIEQMEINRGRSKLEELTSGPGKLTQALEIDKSFDGIDVTDEDAPFYLADDGFKNFEIVSGKRVGISKAADFEYRFYIKGNRFVSKK
ncbi:MAG: DNA-3-methyladenine glycosylase [Candidatus Dojkabacteria bacterium]